MRIKKLILTAALLAMTTTAHAQWWAATENPQAVTYLPALGDDSMMVINMVPSKDCAPVLGVLLPADANEQLGTFSRFMGRTIKLRVDEQPQFEGHAEIKEVQIEGQERLVLGMSITKHLVRQIQAGETLRMKIGHTSSLVQAIPLEGSNGAIRVVQAACKREANQLKNDAAYIK